MAKQELPWKSSYDFAHERYLELGELYLAAFNELLENIQSGQRATFGMAPSYRVKDANGNEVAFPISLVVELGES